MKNKQDTQTENGSQAAGVVDRFTDKKRGRPRNPREAIIESLKIWQKYKDAEYEKDKIELLFSIFIKEKQ
ncbi:MAG: hypothetical protein V3U87_04165 [Methylococcaceae bacterium]